VTVTSLSTPSAFSRQQRRNHEHDQPDPGEHQPEHRCETSQPTHHQHDHGEQSGENQHRLAALDVGERVHSLRARALSSHPDSVTDRQLRIRRARDEGQRGATAPIRTVLDPYGYFDRAVRRPGLTLIRSGGDHSAVRSRKPGGVSLCRPQQYQPDQNGQAYQADQDQYQPSVLLSDRTTRRGVPVPVCSFSGRATDLARRSSAGHSPVAILAHSG
jgi:transglutaminase-like putative cysteine protease